MATHLYLGVIILAVFATTIANAVIKVVCAKDLIRITWKIKAEMVPHAARLFLGTCMASDFDVLPSGEGEAEFIYGFNDCKFKRQMKGKNLFYRNELTYRPQSRSKPAAYVYPIECVYKRPAGWVPPFLNPGASVSEGRGGLVFHMALLNDQLTHVSKTNVFTLGSFMPIWAAVEQKSHQPLLLLMEECVATTTPELVSGSQVYPIISNYGCTFIVNWLHGIPKFLMMARKPAITRRKVRAGNCSMTRLRALSVAAVTQPASPAPKEDLNGKVTALVKFLCWDP
ncbi:zona pellucida sperm-binding protein 3-like isoform X2 [Cebidichthys violaceus]|uniref:zona pellucida sperm-binding protein 3-like isoform X2 n=1 Tax=Cebidichthys violaceus TaxID=271503 RepID=UPI0035CC15C5